MARSKRSKARAAQVETRAPESRGRAEAVSIAPPAIGQAGLQRLLFRSWETQFAGHHIRVERRVLHFRLLLNGAPVDSRLVLPGRDRGVPVVSAQLPDTRPDVVIVEVFARGLGVCIEARGRKIGGDAS